MLSYKRALPWIVWALASLFYAYQYILRIIPSVTMDQIMTRFGIDASHFGQFSGIYYVGYTLVHIPLGMLLDHIGPKKVLPSSILLTCVGLLPLILGDSWFLACSGRFLIGVGSSAAILGVFKVVRMTFPDVKFGRMLGLSVTIGVMGAVYGSKPVSYLIDLIGMDRVVFLVIGGGIILSFFIFIMVPDQKKGQISHENIFTDMKGVLKAPQVLLICICAGLMIAPMEGFADVWGTPFLVTSYGFAKGTAASLSSLIFVGMGIGSPLLAILAEKSKKYYEIIISCALLMGGVFCLLLVEKIDTIWLSALLLFTGVACAYQILAIYKASTYVKDSLTGLTAALANMVIMFFGYIFHSAIGNTMESFWDGRVVEGVHVYSTEAYSYGLAIIPLGLLLGAVGFIFIRNRSKRFQSLHKS